MSARNTLSAAIATALSFALGSAAIASHVGSFLDVPSDRWFSQHLDYLSDRHIVSGYPDNTFKPMKAVTRAEFATIVAKSQNLPSTPLANSRFSDVPGGHWASGAIESSAAQGWIAGYPNGTFGPNRTITQAEMYTIVSKMVPNTLTDAQVNQVLAKFTDGSSIPGWAQKPVATAVHAGAYVSEVTPTQIDAFSDATRADVATTVAKAINPTFRTPIAMTPADPADPVGPDLRVTGILNPTVEAGGWTVTSTETGKKYTLFEIPERAKNANWWRPGATVNVSGEVREGIPNIYMEGIPLFVDDISVRRRAAGL